ncbi:MAG: hypothetical protein CVU35_03170 [Betaproteobacteria bacterium HGW-Betaproteobacteria-8]|nr:MAG: hypothetical protein CVU35_03170 [Betaproteobacteria bacterium HGW-Betaproteobacteria-8]
MKTRISGKQICMSDLMFSISEAMDIAHHKLALHQLRTAYICWKMAEEAALAPLQIEKLFLAAMLHDIGAFTALEKISHYEFEAEDCEPHCLRGELIYSQVPWLAASARMVRLHHTPWCCCSESIDAPDVMEAQMLMLAEILEREIDRDVYILNQSSALRETIHSKAGKIIHINVVELFLRVSESEVFWLELTAPHLMTFLKYKGPVQHIYGDTAAALKMEEFFTAIIDFRSKYTASHTAGVSSCTTSLGALLGLSESERVELDLAATLHDLGKIGVPNEILEKPGKLTQQEFAMIKMHSYLTFTLLDSVRGLEEVARIAGSHHEKLDGSGYPFRIESDEISTSSRIVAVSDVFTALAEDRPYRAGLSPREIKRIMKDMVTKQHLDGRIVDTLLSNVDEVVSAMKARQEQWTERYYSVLSMTNGSLSTLRH